MWIYPIIVPVLGFGIYAFLSITGVQTRWLSRRSNKAAESMYDNYADPDHKQHPVCPAPRRHMDRRGEHRASPPGTRRAMTVSEITPVRRRSRRPPGRAADRLPAAMC
jgi:hypothetical protein